MFLNIDIELLLAITVASVSFVSGFITFIIFFQKNKNTLNNDKKNTSRSNSVSARLPSLISIEIILLFWYLMCCTPLMLFFWFYLPTHIHSFYNIYNIIGSSIFVISFIPIYTTHIIRIWLLKLKYNITSLSMLNQLGMIKWKDIRNTIWTKIYYKYKWSHNIKILIIISILFDIIISIIYTFLLFINYNWRIYLNAGLFGSLTFCLICGIYSLKSFQDTFNIFREEIIILTVWFIALLIYGILYYFLWDYFLILFLNEIIWTIAVTFFGSLAALISIIIHFYFNNKSIETIQKNLPSLSIIVSTKEGLETFLKFLVTELSVENLEFFTLSMRWRHRLVLRDQRRAKRIEKQIQSKPILNKPKMTETLSTISRNNNELETATAKSIALHTHTRRTVSNTTLHNISEIKSSDNNCTDITTLKINKFKSSKNVINATSQMLLSLHKRESANEAQTHLQQLPFPILTFEFLDRDVIKKNENKLDLEKKKSRDNTLTETSYVLEFSKTIQNTQQPFKMEKNITDRSTAVSVFFEQYDVMQNNKRRIMQNNNNEKRKSYTVKIVEHALINEPISQTSISFKQYEFENNNKISPITSPEPVPITPNMMNISAETTHTRAHTISANKITPFVTYIDNNNDDNINKQPCDFILSSDENEEEEEEEDTIEEKSAKSEPIPCAAIININNHKQNKTLSPIIPDDNYTIVKRLSIVNKNNNNNNRIKKDTIKKGWFDNNDFDMYDEEWTDEFMSKKRVDYDRFNTLSEEINISFGARKSLRNFFKLYPTVKVFKEVTLCEYDNSFQTSWKDVWENLNDSLRRFHQSIYYQKWLTSNAANGLNVIPMHI